MKTKLRKSTKNLQKTKFQVGEVVRMRRKEISPGAFTISEKWNRVDAKVINISRGVGIKYQLEVMGIHLEIIEEGLEKPNDYDSEDGYF